MNELNQESKEDDIVYTDEPIEELNLERNFNKIHLDSDSKILTNYPEQRVLEIKTDNDKNKNSMTERGFKLIQVEGDGNCGFYSILATLGIDMKYHGNLRKLITDAMSNDEEILNGLAINDTDNKDIQIKTYINSMRKNGVWMSFSELVMFYKLTKFNIIIEVAKKTKGKTTYSYKYIPESDIMFSSGYICLQLETSREDLQGHFNALIEAIPDENNRRKINEISNRLNMVFKEMELNPSVNYTNYMLSNIEPVGFLYSRFRTVDNKANGNCMFASLALAMGMDESLGIDVKDLILEITQGNENSNDTENNNTGYNSSHLQTFAEYFECKLVVFLFEKGITDYYSRLEFYGNSYEFSIYLVISWTGESWHCKTATPRNKEFYGNYQLYERACIRLKNEIILRSSSKDKNCKAEEQINGTSQNKKSNVNNTKEAKVKNIEDFFAISDCQEKNSNNDNCINDNNKVNQNENKLSQADEDRGNPEDGQKKKPRKAADKSNNKETYNFLDNIPFISRNCNNNKLLTIYNTNEKERDELMKPLIEKMKGTKSLAERSVHDKLKLISKSRGNNDLKDKTIKNIYISDNMPASDLYNKYDISGPCAKTLGPAICGGCSGLNGDKKPVYRVLNSAFTLREHAQQHVVDKVKQIPAGSMINIEVPDEYMLLKAHCGSFNKCFMMKKTDVPNNVKWAAEGKKILEYVPDYITIEGWNMMKSAGEDNLALINSHLIKEHPDILILNEPGRLMNKRINSDYKCHGEDAYTKIISHKSIKLKPKLPHWNDEYNKLYEVISDRGSFLVFGVYIRPDECKRNRIIELINRLKNLTNMYDNPQIILFGDLNINKTELFSKYGEIIKSLNGTIQYSKIPHSFTRFKTNKGIPSASYIDYFINFNIPCYSFTVEKPIGRSDHMMLKSCYLTSELKNHTSRKKELVFNMGKINENAEEILNGFTKAISSNNPTQNLSLYVDKLKTIYKYHVKKIKDNFTLPPKLEDIISNHKYGCFKELAKLAKQIKKEAYESFLVVMNKLKLDGFMKEFFMKLRFYSEINKKVDILRDLEIEGTITDDKDKIDKELIKKFKTLFHDNGFKMKYQINNPPLKNEIITFTEGNITDAIKALKWQKATSWDLIPGKIFNLIQKKKKNFKHEYENIITNLTNTLNEMVYDYEKFPCWLTRGRLICLNKDASKHGNLDNVRGLAVNSSILKLLEIMLLKIINKTVYENKLIHRAQIGFMKGLGCEVNLMRLRQRVEEVKKLNERSYVIFIDLKNAYDSVPHNILFERLERATIHPGVIRILKMIYSNAMLQPNLSDDAIRINRGVLQGYITSPILFNLFLNELIVILSQNSFEVLAYADDIAVICKNEKELDNVISIIESWTSTNKLLLNKKKSAIMTIGKRKNKWVKYRGFPIVNQYRYLGILINYDMNPIGSIEEVLKKLKVYISRNKWLIKKYFRAKTLIEIAECFQHSRLTYGACVFLPDKKIIRKIKDSCNYFYMSTLGMRDELDEDTINLIFARGRFENMLMVRLSRVLRKYENQFGSFPSTYTNIKEEYDNWLGTNSNKYNSDELHHITMLKSLKEIGTNKNLIINNDFIINNKRWWRTNFEGKDIEMVRFLSEYGWFNHSYNRRCIKCKTGAILTRKHIVDECPIYENWRKNTIRRLRQGGFRISKKTNLEETLMNIFIKNDRNKMSMKNRKKLMISIVSDLYSRDKKGEKFKKRYKRFYKSYIFKRNRRKLRKSRVNFF